MKNVMTAIGTDTKLLHCCCAQEKINILDPNLTSETYLGTFDQTTTELLLLQHALQDRLIALTVHHQLSAMMALGSSSKFLCSYMHRTPPTTGKHTKMCDNDIPPINTSTAYKLIDPCPVTPTACQITCMPDTP